LSIDSTISFALEVPSSWSNLGYHFSALGDIKTDIILNAYTTTSNILIILFFQEQKSLFNIRKYLLR